MNSINRSIVFVLTLLVSLNLWAVQTAAAEDIPEELARWRAWVLHGYEDQMCPMNFNDRSVARCQWPSRLQLTIGNEGGAFEQRWQMFAPGWVTLPGDADAWPDSVAADGRPVAVVDRGGVAAIHLTPGDHRVNGRFAWRRMPPVIHVPPDVGLLSLSVDGQKIHAPLVDEQGRLWLNEQQPVGDQPERLKARIFRLLDDAIPMRVTTAIRLEVTGQPREVRLEGVLPENAVPMQFHSPLPLLVDPDGSLILQVRPGQWDLQLLARFPEPVHKLAVGQTPYGDEVWSFQARHHLRMVDITGADRVEPSRTEMPQQWRQWPAYRIKSGSILMFKELRRGDPHPAPDQLTLNRRLWLDFNGDGFTVQDRINGALSRSWSLSVRPPLDLGRVAIDGADQVISNQGKPERAGVQLRRGQLDLLAESRLPLPSGSFATVGWDHDFQHVAATLNLPPGWRLLAATGVDRISDSWLERWTLLDFFLALIIGLAVFKLRSRQWGLLALAAMVLTFHEPGAPRLVWLNLLAVLALYPRLPSGWIRRLVLAWGVGAMAILLISAVPFMVNQIRWGIFPQLAPHGTMVPLRDIRVPVAPQEKAAAVQPEISTLQAPAPQSIEPPRSHGEAGPGRRSAQMWPPDPAALIPTGPGLPDWTWRMVNLEWSGPVSQDQRMHLYLLSPWVNLLLALLRVATLTLLIGGVFDWRPWLSKAGQAVNAGGGAAAVLIVLAALQAGSARASETGFPPPELLDALRDRLLEPADCYPHCADVSRLELAVSADELQLMLKAHAAAETAMPLPVNRTSWSPEQILLDNAPISGLARDATGLLWAVIPKGLHTIVLLGSVAQAETLQIPLPLKPHSAAYSAEDWQATGFTADGSTGSGIQLTRIHPKHTRTKSAVDGSALPPFFHVTRRLLLGTHWQVHTTVERVTPAGTPVVANVPLLDQEALTTAGLHVEQGQVLIDMAPEQTAVRFTSTLTIAPEIEMTAPRSVPWTESWILNASPIWHCEFAGLNAIHHQDDTAHWRPQWKPWPGEKLTIHISRPEALQGQTVTVHRAQLTLTPGRRQTRAELDVHIRTSQGGQHTIELPPRANLQAVQVDNRSLPVQQDGQWVTFPLHPGDQQVSVAWNTAAAFNMFYRVPAMKIGESAINADIRVNMPPSRWILLTGGPRWGPAVLFWGYLAVIGLAAFGLGKVMLTPLKGWQWFLLGLGLTQVPVAVSLVVVGWLLATGVRERQRAPGYWLTYNLLQLGSIGLAMAALACLLAAVHAGLIGQPEMQIAGNQSTAAVLHWTQDRIASSMPQPWVISLPVWIYRGLMLAWSLWLAFALLAWLKWCWRSFSKDGVWHAKPPKSKPVAAAR